MNKNTVKFIVRLPKELAERLKRDADKNGASQNSWIIYSLTKSQSKFGSQTCCNCGHLVTDECEVNHSAKIIKEVPRG